jgi:hypothetical protein
LKKGNAALKKNMRSAATKHNKAISHLCCLGERDSSWNVPALIKSTFLMSEGLADSRLTFFIMKSYDMSIKTSKSNAGQTG